MTNGVISAGYGNTEGPDAGELEWLAKYGDLLPAHLSRCDLFTEGETKK